MQRLVDCYILTDVSEEHIAFSFRIEEYRLRI